jgi:polyisoprenoid-binding protein YceI
MRGDSVLDVAKFPAASFTIKQIKKLDKPSQRNLPRIQLDGDFLLHGVTRPIQVVAEVEEKNGWTHLMGGFTMLQSQFGITPFKKAFGAVGVADQLSVWGDLWISKRRQIAERPPATR